MADYLEIARRYVARMEADHANAVNAINAESPSLEQGQWALRYLNRIAGARFIKRSGGFAVAVWPERRGPELELALRVLRLAHLPLLDREHQRDRNMASTTFPC